MLQGVTSARARSEVDTGSDKENTVKDEKCNIVLCNPTNKWSMVLKRYTAAASHTSDNLKHQDSQLF
jgi:hypothetical protein